MKKSILHLSLCLPLLYGSAEAIAQNQRHICGSSIEDQRPGVERLLENRRMRADLLARRDAKYRSGDTITYIPILFHIVGTSEGAGYISIEKIFENMCRLNTDYASQKIQFFMPRMPRYINNDALYTNDKGQLATYLMSLNRESGYVNVFIGDDIVENGGFGTILGYYTAFPDVVYAIKGTVNGSSKTLTHELGHYFTLPHPFFGWEDEQYTTVVAANGNKPPRMIGGEYVEMVARTGGTDNCHLAADKFCDTKPDYNFGLFASGCSFAGAVDPDSIPVDPASAADNFMSYFNDNCTVRFSEEQKEAIVMDVVARGYDRFAAPDTNHVSAAPSLVWPTAAAPSPYTMTNFRWTAAPHAAYYLVTVNRTLNNGATFVSRYGQWLTTSTDLWVDLQANTEYTWNVRAYNTLDFCGYTSDMATTRTLNWTVGVNEVAGIESSKVYPNPVRNGIVTVEMTALQNTEANVSIVNALGQVVMAKQSMALIQGTNIETFDLSMLAAGVYVINIESNKGRISHKVMLQD